MARINHVAKARKGGMKCSRCGTAINVGDSYMWFANLIGRTSIRKNFCSRHRPRASEMTTSDKLSRAYAAQESVEDAQDRTTKDAEGKTVDLSLEDYMSNVASALESAASEAREVAEEYRDSVSNMPENLQNGSQAEEMNQKAEDLDAWADALESAQSNVEGMDADDWFDDDSVKLCEAHTKDINAETCSEMPEDEECEHEKVKGREGELEQGFDQVDEHVEEAMGSFSL